MAPSSRSIIDDVLRHESWLSRIGGSWRRHRQSFSSHHASGAPKSTRELIEDAHEVLRAAVPLTRPSRRDFEPAVHDQTVEKFRELDRSFRLWLLAARPYSDSGR
jgi:hypothetical protein